jgi:hypothetical protein
MPRVVIDPAVPDGKALDTEIARLRGLDVGQLRAKWHTAFRRRAPPHLPRHLLFHILAYRLQADRLGELDADSRRLLDRIGSGSSDETDRLVADLNRTRTELKPGTLLTREWGGHLQRVMVLADGFSWNGTTYPSRSKVAFAITGTRWSGPRPARPMTFRSVQPGGWSRRITTSSTSFARGSNTPTFGARSQALLRSMVPKPS